MQYRQVLDRFALNNLIKKPNIPDFHLMIGTAECLDGQPITVYEESKIPAYLMQNYREVKELNSDDVALSIANNSLEVNDLNWNVALIGSGLGV